MQYENPYTPPAAMEFPPPGMVSEDRMKPAGQGKRFINMILDSIIISVLSFGVGIVYGLLFVFTRANPAIPLTTEEEAIFDLIGTLLGWVVMIMYYVVFELFCQRSLAKFITGTRVVRNDGGVPTLGQIVGRSFARLIPFEAFSFFGNNGYPIGWHDSLSGTRVIEV